MCVCVCDTEERGGQCLNVTTFLFAVNYYEDRAIGSVTRQSKHFLARSEGDRRKEVSCLFVLIFFFSFLPSKIKLETVKQAPNSCQRNREVTEK